MKNNPEERKNNINRGIELTLRQAKKEESEKFNVHFSKMISLFSREFSRNYDTNLKDAIDNQNLGHIFSISFRYFIDYNSLKNSRVLNSFTAPKTRTRF